MLQIGLFIHGLLLLAALAHVIEVIGQSKRPIGTHRPILAALAVLVIVLVSTVALVVLDHRVALTVGRVWGLCSLDIAAIAAAVLLSRFFCLKANSK